MKKQLVLEITLIGLGLVCLFSFINEPFALSPIIGDFFIALGLLSIISRLIAKIFKFMKKQLVLEIALIGLGLVCLISYFINGAHVDDQGILQEPFALLPIGGFFIALGLLSIISRLIVKIFKFFFKKK